MKGFEYTTCPLFPGPEYRSVFMNECFELVYHGGGGFSWSEVWNMPISHRRYNIKKIQEFLEMKAESQNNQNRKLSGNTDFSKLVPPEVRKLSQDRAQDQQYFTKASTKKSPKSST
jgi:hypothetical protein